MNAQLLLIDRLESSYHRLQKLLLEIDECKYKLIWTQELASLSSQSQSYDVCLVAYEIVAEDLAGFVKRLGTKALIVLTTDDESGQKALDAGALDYFNIDTLTLSELRRSLRLIGKIAQPQTPNHSIQTLFEQTAAGIFLLDVSPQRQLTFIAANQTYQNLASPHGLIKLGSSPQAELIKPIADQLIQYCHICLDSAEAVVYEQPITATQQIWQISITPIFTSYGTIHQLHGIVVDVTGLKDQVTIQHRYLNLLRTLSLKIAQSESVEQILTAVTVGIRSILKTDRVTVFQYLVDGSAKAIADTVKPGYPSLLNLQFKDFHYYDQLHNKQKEHYSYVCNDVETADLPPECVEFVAQFQIKSYLIVPIYVKSRSVAQDNSTVLWGVIGVQQCANLRTWTTKEIVFLHQIAEQISISLERSELSQLEAAQKQELANSNTRLEEFAYTVCHDLQSPLQIMANYAQLLQRCYRDQLEPTNRYVEYIYHESMRMQQQIQALLAYARIGHNHEAIESSDLNLIVAMAIANLSPLLQNKQGIVTIVNRLPRLDVYSDLILLLFQNLIGNGIKYNQQTQPQVTIDAQPQTNSWLFKVRDNGIGIESKYHERIFQIFQRLHSDREYEGTGIGLAICKRIVELHQGSIWIESQLDQGTTVYFTLPAPIEHQ